MYSKCYFDNIVILQYIFFPYFSLPWHTHNLVQTSVVVERGLNLEVENGPESLSFFFLALCPWASHLTSLKLKFLISERGILILKFWFVVRIKLKKKWAISKGLHKSIEKCMHSLYIIYICINYTFYIIYI